MIELLIALSLSPMNPVATSFSSATAPEAPIARSGAAAQLASKPFTTCQMPNKCAKPAAAVASFQPCVWPNTCAKPVAKSFSSATAPEAPIARSGAVNVLAQYRPCVWPNTCSGAVESVL